MTQETLDRARANRKERYDKLEQYNNVSNMFNHLSDDKIIWLDVCGNSNSRIHPTNAEYREFLRTVRNRLDEEIVELDKEFEGL